MPGPKDGFTGVAAGIRKKVVIGESWEQTSFEGIGKVHLQGDVIMKRRLGALVALMWLMSFLIASLD